MDIATKLDKSNQDNSEIEKPPFLSSDKRFTLFFEIFLKLKFFFIYKKK